MDSSFVQAILESAGAGTAIMVILILTGFFWVKPAVDEIKRLHVAAMAAKDKAYTDAIGQLTERAERAETRAERAEAKADEVLGIANEKLIPLVAAFVQTTSALLPILQARGEGGHGHGR